MKLTVTSRVHERKSDAIRLRRNGQIPAVIYHKSKDGEAISFPAAEFTAGLRQTPSGRLSTTICHLTDDKGKERRVVVKDIQYHPVSYDVLHLDFEELHDDRPVKIKIPIVLVGELDSVGIKLGGMVRLVIRSIRVECLPKDIPAFFEVDITNMGIGEAIRIEELPIPNTVRPLMKLNSVAISMVKK